MQDNGDLFRDLNERGWKADVQQVNAFKATVDRSWYKFEKQQAYDIGQAELDQLDSSLRRYEAEIDKLVAEKKVSEAQAENLKSENSIIKERLQTQKQITRQNEALVDKLIQENSYIADKNDAEIDRIYADTDRLIHAVYQGYMQSGADLVSAVAKIADVVSKYSKLGKKAALRRVEKTVYNGKGKVVKSETTNNSYE